MEISKSVERRLWERVEKNADTGCWEWTAGVNTSGYGQMKIKGRKYLAHRISYTIHKGSIREGICVLHKCDNPLCVNPDHLWQGTHAENMHDRNRKGRASGGSLPGESHPHAKLTRKQIRRIRKDYASGKYYQRELAEREGVTESAIGLIVRRETWSHVE